MFGIIPVLVCTHLYSLDLAGGIEELVFVLTMPYVTPGIRISVWIRQDWGGVGWGGGGGGKIGTLYQHLNLNIISLRVDVNL